MSQVPLKATIVDDHGALITWALRRMHVPSAAHEDASQGGAVGLLTALDRFDPDRGAYRSFAASHVLHEVRNAVGWTRRIRVHLVDLNAPEVEALATYEDNGYDRAEYADAIVATTAFVVSLDPSDQYLLRRLYEDGGTQTEVAREMGTNKMAISRRVAKLHGMARLALALYAEAA